MSATDRVLLFNMEECTLQEYVVVLVGHGKHRMQAINDLKAFLGDQSEAFVSWSVTLTLFPHCLVLYHLFAHLAMSIAAGYGTT